MVATADLGFKGIDLVKASVTALADRDVFPVLDLSTSQDVAADSNLSLAVSPMHI